MALVSNGVVKGDLKTPVVPNSSNIVYMSEDGRVVEKNEASKVVITQYDEKGNIIGHVYGDITNTSLGSEERSNVKK